VAETPDKLGYDFGPLGLYDDRSRRKRRKTWGMAAFKIFVSLSFMVTTEKLLREYCAKGIGINFKTLNRKWKGNPVK
jgi:hypothetical protein